MAPARAHVRIGISGWRYEPWRGVFYPEGLPQRLELPYAAHNFNSIEINGSFYSLQAPASWRAWYADTPARFVFSVKGPRFITHMLKLRDVEQPLANFLASGLLALRGKLGPILWQFAPWLTFRPKRFEAFFAMLPHDTEAALRLARRRHPRMHGRSVLAIDAARPMRHAVEIRNASFLDRRFVDLLREHRVALVVAETARTWPMPHDVTADFMYLRLHGDRKMYQSGYSDTSLDRWAKAIRAWRAGREPEDLPPGAVRVGPAAPPRPQGRDVFCYFDNTDVKLRAPADARGLMARLGVARAYDPAALVDLLRRRNGR
ncbi:MAG TPA: DUF72 domain-containing protein [Candidatus Polarisedimenticolia bacterium]|nr:DUF72 domain-containing protein [Candidatus Polarisedimenticolia bacterium]